MEKDKKKHTGTFVVHVSHCDNATWQGEVTWAEANKSTDFQFKAYLEDEEDRNQEPVQYNAIPEGTPYRVKKNDSLTDEVRYVGKHNIFTLKAGESAVFEGIDSGLRFYAEEVGILSDQFDKVDITDWEVTYHDLNGNLVGTSEGKVPEQTKTYLARSGVKTAGNAARVEFKNTCNVNNLRKLRITKKMNGLSTTDKFSFQVYLTGQNRQFMGKTEVKGYTGTITLTKYAEDGKTILKGAEFKLYKATKDKVKEENSGVSALRFIKLGDGIYKLALADNEATSTDTLVAVNGTLTVKGLDEGTYWFEETKAPEGYSINVDGASATIKESKDKNVTVPTSLKDTKLSALPSTGGIGTTIFTIAGCLIMVTAAGLFFASRKRTNK